MGSSLRSRCERVAASGFRPGQASAVLGRGDRERDGQGACQRGHTNPAAVVFNADGSLAAAASGDGVVHLFDPATGAAKGLLLGRSRQGRKLSFSPDGKTVAACGDDCTIQRRTAADGKRLGTTESPFALEYGPRSASCLPTTSASSRGEHAGWSRSCGEAPSGKLLTPAGGHMGSVHSAAVAGGGAEIFTSSQDGRILRWNPATGKELGPIALKIPGAAGFPLTSTPALSPDGTRARQREHRNRRLRSTVGVTGVCHTGRLHPREPRNLYFR